MLLFGYFDNYFTQSPPPTSDFTHFWPLGSHSKIFMMFTEKFFTKNLDIFLQGLNRIIDTPCTFARQ